LRHRTIDTFIWPSGAKTVVETTTDTTNQKQVKLNGAETRTENFSDDGGKAQRATVAAYANQNGNDDPLVVCWPNPVSGNRFCFLDAANGFETTFFQGIDQ
jgi:hypothetical protein